MRAEELRTKRETLSAFSRAGSARIIAATLLATLVARAIYGRFGWLDLFLLAASLALVGVVEWVIHLFLLHAPASSFRMRTLKTGTGHREHHLDPGHLGWLLLGPIDAAVFVVMIAAGSFGWTYPIAVAGGMWFDDASWIGLGLTATAAAIALMGHYEWTHLLVHTRYRPRSRYYKRLARNHRRHHYRNERYWLGVTSNLGDRLLGSYPAQTSDVERSATARTLSS